MTIPIPWYSFFPNAAGNFPFTISLSVSSSPLHSFPIHFSSCDKVKKIHSLTPASHCSKVSVTVGTSKIRGATVPGPGWNGTWFIAHILSYPLSPCIAFLQHSSEFTTEFWFSKMMLLVMQSIPQQNTRLWWLPCFLLQWSHREGRHQHG